MKPGPQTLMPSRRAWSWNGLVVYIFLLNPFIDESEILCLGGCQENARLLICNSSLHHTSIESPTGEAPHPIRALSPSSRWSVVDFVSLSRRYHILGGHKAIRSITLSWVVSRWHSAKPTPQLMGQLPKEWVTPDTAFNNVGVDYAGPVYVKQGSPCKPIIVKACVCICVPVHQSSTHWSHVWSHFWSIYCLLEEINLQKREAESTVKWPWVQFHWCKTHHQWATWILEQEPPLPNHCWHLQHSRDPVGLHTRTCPTLGGLWICREESQNSPAPNSWKFSIELWRVNHRPLSNRSLPKQQDPRSRSPLQGRSNGGTHTRVLPDWPPHRRYWPSHWRYPRSWSLSSTNLDIALLAPMWSASKTLLEEMAVAVSHKSPEVLQVAQTGQEVWTWDFVVLRENNTMPMQWWIVWVIQTHHGQDGLVRVVKLLTNNGTYTPPVNKVALLLTMWLF